MKLTDENIVYAVNEIKNFFEKLNVTRKDKLKLCFLFKSSLLRYQKKFGENQEFELIKRKWFGAPKVVIKIFSNPYPPLADDDEKTVFSKDIARKFLNFEEAKLAYRYENGCNEISAVSTKKFAKIKIPGGSTTIAIILAIILGLIMQIFPETTQKAIAGDVVTPILSKLFGAIIAVNIPLVFISIVASICSVENVAVLHDLSSKIFKRFFLLLIFVAIISAFVGSIFFPVLNINFGGQILSENYSELHEIFDLILSAIPQNLVEPFIKREILQIVVLAFLTGICVTILGEKVQEFKDLILNLQTIIVKMVSIVFKIIPVIIFLCILKIMLLNSGSEIFNVWRIVAAEYSIYLFLSLTMLFKNYFLYGVKIKDFLKKIHPACVISFMTGSGSAAMPKNIEVCSKSLKIEKNLCNFYIPLSHPLCPATKTIGFIVYTLFAAQFSGKIVTLSQLIVIMFLAVQFAISASNSGNGGMVAMFTLLLMHVGFSLDAIGVMMIADIFVLNISGAVSIIIRDCDLLDFSHRVEFSYQL